jgi:hypothetical protein
MPQGFRFHAKEFSFLGPVPHWVDDQHHALALGLPLLAAFEPPR